MPSSGSQSDEYSVDDTLQSLEYDIYSNSSRISTIRRLQLETIKNGLQIKRGLTIITKEMNLLLLMILAIMCYNWFLMGTQWLTNPYLAPELYCDILELGNVSWSNYEKRNLTTPKDTKYQPGCEYYDYDYDSFANFSYEEAMEEIAKIELPRIITCKNVKIIKDVPKEISFITDFDITCRRPPLYLNDFYAEIGKFLLGFPVGVLADMYGRRQLHIVCATITCVASFLPYFATSYVEFAIGKVIAGGSFCATNFMLILIYSETFLHKYRPFSTMTPYAWFMLGSQQTSAAFKVIEVWRLRNLAFAFATWITLFSAVMFVPESPRFLVMKRQFSTAWDCLEELGYEGTRPDVKNSRISYFNFSYQMKIMSKPYLQYRLYTVMLLNGTGVYFFYLFRNMEIGRLSISDSIRGQVLMIEILLLIFSAAITVTYTKNTMICTYYILICLCFTTTMITGAVIIKDVCMLAGNMFAETLYIISLTYTIDVFPTTHRATSVGICLSTGGLLSILVEMFHKELTLKLKSDYLNSFYCALSMLCALVAVIAPETDSELPDRKSDLARRLSLSSVRRRSS